MGYEKERPGIPGSHHIILEERERLMISGVEDVARFDEETIVLTTTLGALEIQGANLHIETLSLDGGDLKVEGEIHALVYDTEEPTRGGLFRRLFGG